MYIASYRVLWDHLWYIGGVPRKRPSRRDIELRQLTRGLIKDLMEAQRVTPVELARRLGDVNAVGKPFTSRVMGLLEAERPITLELIEQLARAFGMPALAFLVEGNAPIWQPGEVGPQLEQAQHEIVERFRAESERLRHQFGIKYATRAIREVTEGQKALSALVTQLEMLSNQLRVLQQREFRHYLTLEFTAQKRDGARTHVDSLQISPDNAAEMPPGWHTSRHAYLKALEAEIDGETAAEGGRVQEKGS